jgi:hypothetical protein
MEKEKEEGGENVLSTISTHPSLTYERNATEVFTETISHVALQGIGSTKVSLSPRISEEITSTTSESCGLVWGRSA